MPAPKKKRLKGSASSTIKKRKKNKRLKPALAAISRAISKINTRNVKRAAQSLGNSIRTKYRALVKFGQTLFRAERYTAGRSKAESLATGDLLFIRSKSETGRDEDTAIQKRLVIDEVGEANKDGVHEDLLNLVGRVQEDEEVDSIHLRKDEFEHIKDQIGELDPALAEKVQFDLDPELGEQNPEDETEEEQAGEIDSGEDPKESGPAIPLDDDEQGSGDPRLREFAAVKLRLAQNSAAIKKINAKEKKNQKLTALEGKAKREFAADEMKRLKLRDELFVKWKESKGWAGKRETEVLRQFDNNWFRMKDELAYRLEGETPEQYQLKLAAMESMIQFRKDIVEGLLRETEARINEIHRGEYDFNLRSEAFGSVTPTSDFDVTFVANGYPQFEQEAVSHFNKTFLERFGFPSGMLFDTNVYTSGFMPSGDNMFLSYKDKFNPLPGAKTSDLSKADQTIVEKGKTEKHQIQLALSMTAILQVMDSGEWSTFKLQSLNSLAQHIDDKGKTERRMSKEERERVIKASQADMISIFAKAAALHDETDLSVKLEVQAKKLDAGLMEKLRAGIDDEDTLEKHIETIAKDSLYVKSLENVAGLLEKISENSDALLDLDDPNRQTDDDPNIRKTLFQERVNLITEFEQEQGKALIYANEAYFSGGAAVHVVKGMQGGQGVSLGRQQKMQSLLMNIGYKINHFQEQAHEHGMGRALVGTSKYGQRIGNIALGIGQDSAPDKALAESLTPGTRKLMEDDEVLIKNYKKDDINLPTPTEKEAAAARAYGEMTPQKIKEGYLEVASKSMAPYFLDKFIGNQSGRRRESPAFVY